MLTLVTHVHTRLRIVASSETSVLVRSGERAVLWCETSEPWFLCVWDPTMSPSPRPRHTNAMVTREQG